MFHYCTFCEQRTHACKYNPRMLLIALSDTLDNFEQMQLECPADYLVFSDIHKEFVELRSAINSVLSRYEDE